MDRWVGFGSYTFNAAQGGGVTGTFSKHTVTAGALSANIDETRGYRKFNVEGEAGMTHVYGYEGVEDGHGSAGEGQAAEVFSIGEAADSPGGGGMYPLWGGGSAVAARRAVLVPVDVLACGAEAGELNGLSPRQRGPKARKADARDKRIAQLDRENRKLQAKLERAEGLIEVQKKVSEILGVPLESDEKD